MISCVEQSYRWVPPVGHPLITAISKVTFVARERPIYEEAAQQADTKAQQGGELAYISFKFTRFICSLHGKCRITRQSRAKP